MKFTRVLAAVLGTVLLAGCGATSAEPGASASPSLPTGPAAGFDVLVTDNDRAVTVHTGQKIELFLRAKSGMTDWSGVNVDDPTVLRAVPTGITAARGVTIAGFEAIAPGTAKITATAVPLCSPGQACAMIALLFEVVVTVS